MTTGEERHDDDYNPDDGRAPEAGGAPEPNPVLVSGLATGMAHAEIGALIGRSERTVRRRAALPEVREAVVEYRRVLAAQATGRLVALMDDAICAIADSLAGDQALRAADMILRHASRLTSETHSHARMKELAAEIARLMNDGPAAVDGTGRGVR